MLYPESMRSEFTIRDLTADLRESVRVAAAWGGTFAAIGVAGALCFPDVHGRTRLAHAISLGEIGLLIGGLILICRAAYDVGFFFWWRRQLRRGRIVP